MYCNVTKYCRLGQIFAFEKKLCHSCSLQCCGVSPILVYCGCMEDIRGNGVGFLQVLHIYVSLGAGMLGLFEAVVSVDLV